MKRFARILTVAVLAAVPTAGVCDDLVVGPGEVLNPGGDGPGTLRVDGNLIMQEGSIYQCDVWGSGVDRVEVTGNVTLEPGSLVRFYPGSVDELFRADVYQILTSSGITGQLRPSGGFSLGEYVTAGPN